MVAPYKNWAVDAAGNTVGEAQIEVRDSLGEIAEIFSDAAGTSPLTNPFSAETDGSFVFWAGGGEYQITTGVGAQASTIIAVIVDLGALVTQDEIAEELSGLDGRSFDTIQQALDATDLSVGQRILIASRDYDVAAAGTGTADGGRVVDLTGSGLQAILAPGETLPIWAFGSAGSGSDDTAKFQNWASCGGRLELERGKTYLIDEVQFPAGSRIKTNGAVIKISGDTAPATYPAAHMLFGENVTFEDDLYIEADTLFTGTNLFHAKEGFQAKAISLVAPSEIDNGAMILDGRNTRVGFIYSDKFTRPWQVDPEFFRGAGAWATGLNIGGHYLSEVTRGLRFNNIEHATIGMGAITQRSDRAEAEEPGLNGMLVSGAKNCTFGNQIIEDSGEHAIRLAGPAMENVTFGVLTVNRCSASAFKINADANMRPRNIQVAGMVIEDPCYETGASAKASHVIRISHTDGFHCGPVTVRQTGDYVLSPGPVIAISNSRSVTFDDVDNGLGWQSVLLTDQNDLAGDIIVGVSGVVIKRLKTGESDSGEVVGINMQEPGGTVGNVTINFDMKDRDGSSDLFNVASATAGYSGPFHVGGYVQNFYSPDTADLAAATIHMDLKTAETRYITGNQVFDPSNGKTATLFLDDRGGTQGEGNYGQAIAVSRISGGRVGAALAAKQTGSDGDQVGWAVFAHKSGTSSDILEEIAVFGHDGTLTLTQAGKGIRLKSPDGTFHEASMANGGSWSIS